MPRILKVNAVRPDRGAIREAAEIVSSGGLVVYPTDTVYGLASNPFSEEAVKRLFRAKGRPENKPIPVLVDGVETAEEIAHITRDALKLIENYWPGPLTIVLRVKRDLPCLVTACTGRVGLRVPGHMVALLLAKESGGAITGTSANISGWTPPRTAEEAIRQLGDRVDLVLDAGPSPGGKPSTVVDLSGEEPVLVREGPIPVHELEKILGKKIKRAR